ncbi:MAG: AmmeMemoRadiSam system protein B [Phycisphaerales bacterium]|nr:AmmeMemoRadiSam system protein B [Phycisphaerales bacterium]
MSNPIQPDPRDVPPFNPASPHHARPKIRAIQGFPVHTEDGQTILGIRDARQVSDKVIFTNPLAQFMLPHMTGEHGVEEVARRAWAMAQQHQVPAQFQQAFNAENARMLVAQLDAAGFLEGPVFDGMLAEMRSSFDSSEVLPPAATADFADALVVQEVGQEATAEQKTQMGPEKLRRALDQWMDEALKPVSDPSFDALPKAVFAPHLDYYRGWPNYAHVYGRMRVVDRPDRVIILGTNHFGMGTGVTACDKGFATPLGVSKLDSAFADAVKKHLSAEQARQLFEHRYDHEREHSIELHLPWIQHVFADKSTGEGPRVFAALVHDPLPNNGESYDNNGLGLMPFVDALQKAIAESPGRTLVVSSADLSHIGRSFGDQQTFVGEDQNAANFRNRVVQHDQAMLQLVADAKPDELVASLAWQENWSRWCSLGNIVAAIKATRAEKVKILHYAAAGDDQGVAMVSSFAGAVF